MRNGLGATEGVTSETLGVLRWGGEEEGEDQEKEEVGARL